MYYDNPTQIRTFKIVDKDELSADDVEWIMSLLNVSLVTVQEKTIRVRTEIEDAIGEIVNSINKKYCKSSKPKLSPLF